MTDQQRFIIEPGGRLSGQLRVPGDKSISHRAVMFGALAAGCTEVEGFLEGEDTLATMAAFKQMGVQIEGPEHGRLLIHGVGLHGLKAPQGPLDLGNSGTSMRLMSGLLAAQPFDSVLSGDASLSRRPMGRVIEPLTRMGARIDSSNAGRPPLHIHQAQRLKGIDYPLPMASAQVKSCLLLAGLYAEGKTTISEPAATRDHTERMLQAFGYQVECGDGVVSLHGGGQLQASQISVPGDISSAAFALVGALIAPAGRVTLEGVGINPTRTGCIDILRLMGGSIVVTNERLHSGEPVADLVVSSSQLRGIEVPEALVPLAIDEFPALFVAAACASGTTVVTGAEELRVKESDRIASMASGLQTLGISATATDDGMIIEGGAINGGEIDSHDDHRIAMAFAIAGLRASAAVIINDCANVRTSFPGFVSLMADAGLPIREQIG